jgi:hypothetical protein
MVERITVAEFHDRLKRQGTSSLNHVALVCPMCSTVQSMASLRAAGATPEQAERMIGFSCEGRLTNAGPWPAASDQSHAAKKRRKVRGCDWTLGGLFKIHTLEVLTPDGEAHPRFAVATGASARALEQQIEANAVRTGDAA